MFSLKALGRASYGNMAGRASFFLRNSQTDQTRLNTIIKDKELEIMWNKIKSEIGNLFNSIQKSVNDPLDLETLKPSLINTYRFNPEYILGCAVKGDIINPSSKKILAFDSKEEKIAIVIDDTVHIFDYSEVKRIEYTNIYNDRERNQKSLNTVCWRMKIHLANPKNPFFEIPISEKYSYDEWRARIDALLN